MSAAENIRKQEANQLYRKAGRKYVPVPEMDSFGALQNGWHLVRVCDGWVSRKATVHPDRAEFDAAMRDNVESIIPIISKALEARPRETLMNPDAKAAWEEFVSKWGKHFQLLEADSVNDIAENIIEELSKKI